MVDKIPRLRPVDATCLPIPIANVCSVNRVWSLRFPIEYNNGIG